MTQTTDGAGARQNLRGIAAISAGTAFIVANDMLIKLASPDLPFGELVFVRGVIATVLIVLVCLATGAGRSMHQVFAWPVVGRSTASLIASFLYLNALFHMPIANVTAIIQATPLLLTALAALLLRERVGWRRWLAICVGFSGVLLIVRPGVQGFSIYAALALGAVFFIAARDLFTRAVTVDVPSIVVTLANSIFVMAGAGVYSIYEGWKPIGGVTLTFIAVSAVCLVCGYHLIVVAFRSGDLSVVSPFRFSVVVWAMIGGYFIWNEVPDLFTFAGIALIVAMGAYTFHRERLAARRENQAPAPPQPEP